MTHATTCWLPRLGHVGTNISSHLLGIAIDHLTSDELQLTAMANSASKRSSKALNMRHGRSKFMDSSPKPFLTSLVMIPKRVMRKPPAKKLSGSCQAVANPIEMAIKKWLKRSPKFHIKISSEQFSGTSPVSGSLTPDLQPSSRCSPPL